MQGFQEESNFIALLTLLINQHLLYRAKNILTVSGSDKMKIWIVGRGDPASAEFRQAKALAGSGQDVSYFSLFLGVKSTKGLRLSEEDGVKVYSYSSFSLSSKTQVRKHWQRLFEKAEETDGQPDLIHIHNPLEFSNTEEIERYKTQGTRICVTEHSCKVLHNELKKKEITRLQYFTTHTNCFISVSKILQATIGRYSDITVPTAVLPEPVPPEFFKGQPSKGSDEFTFVCIGNLIPENRFDAIIRQYKANFLNKENVRLLIIGTGHEESKLADEAEGRVYFSFQTDDENTAYNLTKADTLISFGKANAFDKSVAEAWAAGKPAIVSKESGIAEFMNGDLGFSVDSEEALGKAMISVYNHYANYDDQKIRAFAKTHFSEETILTELLKIYQRI